MKKLMIAVTIFCTCSLTSIAQDSTWKSTKKQKTMYKNGRDSMGAWSDTTIQKSKMWKKDKMNKMNKYKDTTMTPMNKYKDTTMMPMIKKDSLK